MNVIRTCEERRVRTSKHILRRPHVACAGFHPVVAGHHAGRRGVIQTRIGMSGPSQSQAILLPRRGARRVVACSGFRAILCSSAAVLCGGGFLLSESTNLSRWFGISLAAVTIAGNRPVLAHVSPDILLPATRGLAPGTTRSSAAIAPAACLCCRLITVLTSHTRSLGATIRKNCLEKLAWTMWDGAMSAGPTSPMHMGYWRRRARCRGSMR